MKCKIDKFVQQVDHFLKHEVHLLKYKTPYVIPFDQAAHILDQLSLAHINGCLKFYHNGDELLVQYNCYKNCEDKYKCLNKKCNMERLDELLKEFKKVWRFGYG